MAELKAFDATKAGVKGVVDSGVKEVPRIFHAPPHCVEPGLPFSPTDPDYILPTIDLAAVHDPVKRKKTVEEIRDASESWGFFQIVNHGVPEKIQEEMMARTQEFFEQDVEEKKKYMGDDMTKKVVYSSNFDLYKSVCASWKDIIIYNLTPDPVQPEEFPECFRESVPEYAAEMMKLGELLFELLSESLGLDKNHLKDIDCMEGFGLGCHYCPPCPQPELTVGAVPHADISFLNIIQQDQIGGLQVLRRGSWIDVPFVPGAMVVNNGDMFQLISNDRVKSTLHRVISKKTGPRISIPSFFGHGTTKSTRMYGPIKEMLSDNDPPKYKETTIRDFFVKTFTKGANDFSILNHLKNPNIIFPVIDLAGVHQDPVKRKQMVEKIRDASGSWGFFQIVNHGVPKNIQEDMTSGVRNFFDLDLEQKKEYYAREQTKKVMYSSNPDMYAIPVCSWTDLMLTHMSADDPLEPEELPECCRDIVPKYSAQMARVRDLLFQLLSEALGLESNYLKEIDCVEAMGYAYHYYPPCPQPELALGCVHHTDIDFLTVILQDQVGGLQVLRHNSWIDVPYVPGALVVNIGDMLQLISNDKFISALHRVRAKNAGPRISIATFFGHGSTKSTRLYGPIKELVSEKDPPKYKEITIRDFFLASYEKGVDGTSVLPRLKLDNSV
ncbi:1-aminocyclopropane-1-carboxylate oxidase homolog 1 [Linum perenne]